MQHLARVSIALRAANASPLQPTLRMSMPRLRPSQRLEFAKQRAGLERRLEGQRKGSQCPLLSSWTPTLTLCSRAGATVPAGSWTLSLPHPPSGQSGRTPAHTGFQRRCSMDTRPCRPASQEGADGDSRGVETARS